MLLGIAICFDIKILVNFFCCKFLLLTLYIYIGTLIPTLKIKWMFELENIDLFVFNPNFHIASVEKWLILYLQENWVNIFIIHPTDFKDWNGHLETKIETYNSPFSFTPILDTFYLIKIIYFSLEWQGYKITVQ